MAGSMNQRTFKSAVVNLILRNNRLAEAVARRVGPPLLFDLWQTARSWSQEPEDMVAATFGISPMEAQSVVGEARAAVETILDHTPPSLYPSHFAVESGTALVLYAAVRLQRTRVMLETGVADGMSTAVVLAAMERNGVGELHSIDIADDVGAFVEDRSRWTLHVVPGNNPAAVTRVIESVAPIDLFFHDGDHRYAQQSAEYEASWKALRPGGLLISDDVDWSCAFLDFVEANGLETTMLLDERKVAGAIVKA